MAAGAAIRDQTGRSGSSRDTLRLEMGFCLYGNDIDDTTSPIEAGLGWITKFTKDFIDAAGTQGPEGSRRCTQARRLRIVDRGIPRHDHPVLDATGKVVGKVTSGTMSPTLQKPIGMAYVPTAMSRTGQ